MARATVLALACLLLAAATVSAMEERVVVGGVWVKVLGQSGKIALGTVKGNREAIVLNFDSMQERDSSGKVVGASGPAAGKHSFRSFASQDFTFTPLSTAEVQGLEVATFNFSATLVGGSSLVVQTYMFKENGTVVTGSDEDTDVLRGNLKFNVYIDNWPWCTAGGSGDTLCKKGQTEQVGATLDFVMELSTKKAPKRRNPGTGGGAGNNTSGRPPMRKCKKDAARMCKQPQAYSVGDGDEAVFMSTVVRKDGVWEDMADAFPSFTAQGSKSVFTVRFPRGNSLYYDPVLSLGVVEDDDGSNAAGMTLPSMATTLLLALVAAVLALRW